MKKLLIWIPVSLFVLIAAIGVWLFISIPSEKQIRGCMITKMYSVNLCPGSKNYVPYSRISKNLVRAVIVSEDASFWTHHGFDWNEIENSLYKNLQKGEYARGGSTITQQLAKNLFLSKEKSLTRKLLEALITVKIEKTLAKKEILERYLNVVEFGKGVFGVKAAAQEYFKKSPAALDPLEASYLTMLLPSPVRYSKSFKQKSLTPYARKRMKTLLQRLKAVGQISEEEYNQSYLMLDWFLKDKAPNEIEFSNDSGETDTVVNPQPYTPGESIESEQPADGSHESDSEDELEL